MSRLRDLRDLISVSRLTYRESDDDIVTDDEETSAVAASFRTLQLSEGNATGKVLGDSGIATNGHASTSECSTSTTEREESDGRGCQRKTRKKRRKKKNLTAPVANSVVADEQSGRTNRGDFDDLLCYLDATIVSEWLIRANSWVNDLSVWCHTGTNFVDLANFLLCDFPDLQRQKILELEYSIFMDELSIAFTAGRDTGHVKNRQLQHLALAVFREYPKNVMPSKGIYMFLDYLDILSSEKRESYRELLSDVKITTNNRQYSQLLLATRAFALASLWFAVVNFYRNLKGTLHVDPALNLDDLKVMVCKDQTQTRFLQAIKCEYIPVLTYFLKTGKVRHDVCDEHQRSLLHLAIINNRERVLDYLLSSTECRLLVNAAAANGNTPLHAAINNGSIAMVRVLLKRGQADCTISNPYCDNATPLHLATMHGYKVIVELLLDAGADSEARMNELTALDVASEFGQTEIYELLISRRQQCE